MIPAAAELSRTEAGGAEPGKGRFTLDGDAGLEANLAATAARVLSGIRGLVPARRIEALLLGGGYGRGEGGVLREAGGDRPYNDLEFYLFLKGNRHANEVRYHRRLEVLAQILTPLADVEVEVKIASVAEWRSRPASMFSYDLALGHRSLAGPAPVLGEQHRSAEELPREEATRLLMNRGTGLLLAQAELQRPALTPAAADFVRRNLAKAQLACGDAVLAARGLYHWSCRERELRLRRLAAAARLPGGDILREHHAAGVAFKLRPVAGGMGREELTALHARVSDLLRACWLELESERLGRAFGSVREYVDAPVDLCPGTSGARNLILNARLARGRVWRTARPTRHPRERIYRLLPALLWEPERAQGEGLEAYRALWAKVQ